MIALVGILRYHEPRSIPQIHEALLQRGVCIAPRTVTDQLYRYEEPLAKHLADSGRLKEQKQVILALDGLQPEVGHEVLWVLRDCCSGEVLLVRRLLGATEQDLVPLLEEVAAICTTLQIPIAGVISDGQHSKRLAFPTSCVNSIICEKPPKRLPMQTGTRKKNERNRYVGCVPSSEHWRGVRMKRREQLRGYCLKVEKCAD